MKVTCPNCQKVLQAPDAWAGKKVKCPRCKSPISLPVAKDGLDDLGLDIGSLEAIETAGEAVVFERKGKPLSLKEAEAQRAATQTVVETADPRIRVCPKCGQKVRSDDIYIDLICRHCGGGIPGKELQNEDRARYGGSLIGRIKQKDTFYTGFSKAAGYPLPAMPWILTGAGIALAAIVVPLLGILAFTLSATLNPVNNKQEADFGWVGVFLTVAFVAEGIYFGSIAYHSLIDTIRTTTSEGDQPPKLTWGFQQLASSLGGYAALVGMYGLVVLALLFVSNGSLPTSGEDFAVLGRPLNIVILSIMTVALPMNLIGLSSGHAMDGLNPVKVFKSIGNTIAHYIFLFLIVLLYLGMYIGLMYAVMSFAAPAIMKAATEGLKAGFVQMLLGVGCWALVIGVGFYFTYSIGRILGLFSRTYKERLDFEL